MFIDSKRIGKAFTLVELLVVISIIALLLAMLMPSLNKAREQAKITVCLSNFKQLGLGLFLYADDNGGRWPSKSFGLPNPALNNLDIKFYSSFQVWLDDPTDNNRWLTGIRPLFLNLLTPKYLANNKSYFCPGSSKNKDFQSIDGCWNAYKDKKGTVGGMWSYMSFHLEWSKKAATLDVSKYGFQAVWSAGPARTKALIPMFCDLYYVYSNTGKPVKNMTWHESGESIIFNDGHASFAKPTNEWFTPLTYVVP